MFFSVFVGLLVLWTWTRMMPSERIRVRHLQMRERTRNEEIVSRARRQRFEDVLRLEERRRAELNPPTHRV